MPDAVQSFGKWLAKYRVVVSACAVLVAIGVTWGIDKADRATLIERVMLVEKKIEQRGTAMSADHDLLIRIDANVQSMGERVKRIEDRQTQ